MNFMQFTPCNEIDLNLEKTKRSTNAGDNNLQSTFGTKC